MARHDLASASVPPKTRQKTALGPTASEASEALRHTIGLYLALRTNTNMLVAWLNGLALVATGVMSVKAGIFPLPDSRHASWGFLTWLTIIMPVLQLIGVWKRSGATALRLYLDACIVLVLLLFPFLSGVLPFVMRQPGTFQRLIALATFNGGLRSCQESNWIH
jgi:hypothetical protein